MLYRVRGLTLGDWRELLLGPAYTPVRHMTYCRLSCESHAYLERVGLDPLMAPESCAGCAAGPGGSGAGPAPPPAPPRPGHGRAAGPRGFTSTTAAFTHASGAAGASLLFQHEGSTGAVPCCAVLILEPVSNRTVYR